MTLRLNDGNDTSGNVAQVSWLRPLVGAAAQRARGHLWKVSRLVYAQEQFIETANLVSRVLVARDRGRVGNTDTFQDRNSYVCEDLDLDPFKYSIFPIQ